MDLTQWLSSLSAALENDEGVLDAHGVRTVLDLARDAAHAIERPAAPLTTFLVGVAVGRGAPLESAANTATALLLDRKEPPDALATS